ncbi:MAG: hypothetical protein HPY74_19580 [Firmicutes bacterium]|nr:hypothetical protein [Bacillota bacterium]
MVWKADIFFTETKTKKGKGTRKVWKEFVSINGNSYIMFNAGELTLRFLHSLSEKPSRMQKELYSYTHEDFIKDFFFNPLELRETFWFQSFLACLKNYANGIIDFMPFTVIINKAKYELKPNLNFHYICNEPVQLLTIELFECLRHKIPVKRCHYCGSYFFHDARKTKDKKCKCSICPAPSKVYGNDKFYKSKHAIYMQGVRQGKTKEEIEDMLRTDKALENAPDEYKKLRKYSK